MPWANLASVTEPSAICPALALAASTSASSCVAERSPIVAVPAIPDVRNPEASSAASTRATAVAVFRDSLDGGAPIRFSVDGGVKPGGSGR